MSETSKPDDPLRMSDLIEGTRQRVQFSVRTTQHTVYPRNGSLGHSRRYANAAALSCVLASRSP